MRKTKICFISYYNYRLFNEKSQITFGGGTVLFYLMAKELIKDKRFEVSFLLEDDVHQQSKTENIDGVKLYKTSRILGLEKGKDKQLDLLVKLYNRLAKRFNKLWELPHQDFFRLWERFRKIKADVYMLASASYEVGLASFICKFLNKKLFFLVGHDKDINKTYVKNNGLMGKIYEFGLKNTDSIFCNSKRHQILLKKTYNRDSLLLPYWYPTQKRILSFNKRDYILWIARIQKWKRPDLFLKLAKLLPKEKFLMIGSVSDRQPELIKKIQDQVKLLSNVVFKQNVPFSKVADYYKQAKIFVETSDYGSMHTSHLMAAAFGTPCLTLFHDPNGSFKEYNWGISSEGNNNKMLENIQRVSSEPKL